MSKDLFIVTCPPLVDYPEEPKDQSHAELFDCPECKGKMWLSDKKKGQLMFNVCLQRDILLRCYRCFLVWALANPDIMKQAETVKI